MIKNIIFDLGNVILDQETFTVRDYFSRILQIPRIESDEFLIKFKHRLDSGKISFEEVFNQYKIEFRISVTYPDFVKRYKELYLHDVVGINSEMIGLVDTLRKNYRVYIMSNTVAPHFESLENMDFTRHFDRIFRSDTDKFVKPEKEAYEFVLKEIKANGSECVFIDDLEVNVRGAEAVGIKGIVYRNPSQLTRDLVKIGVVI
jgi:putative hydrolase of the HAD superfamily